MVANFGGLLLISMQWVKHLSATHKTLIGKIISLLDSSLSFLTHLLSRSDSLPFLRVELKAKIQQSGLCKLGLESVWPRHAFHKGFRISSRSNVKNFTDLALSTLFSNSR